MSKMLGRVCSQNSVLSTHLFSGFRKQLNEFHVPFLGIGILFSLNLQELGFFVLCCVVGFIVWFGLVCFFGG